MRCRLRGRLLFTHVDRIWQRLWPLTKRYWFDALVVAGTIFGVISIAAQLEHGEPFPAGPRWLLAFAMVPVTAPLLLRRRYPFGAPAFVCMYIAAISFLNGDFVPYGRTSLFAGIACCFLFGLLEDRRQSLAGIALGVGAVAIVTYHDPTNAAGDYVWVSVMFCIAWLTGFGLGSKFQQITSAEERAGRAERELLEKARAAVAEGGRGSPGSCMTSSVTASA
jgi:drug/metabolite transporter (DMT)-like permease